MHCEGPSFTHALPMDGGTSIQGQRPSLPAAFAFWREFPENNLEPELGNPIPVLWARPATRTFCPAPACRDLSSALPEFHRRPRLRTWNLGSETWQLWTAPTSVGKLGTLTVDGAQDQLRTDPKQGSRLAQNPLQGESEL